MTQSDQTIQNMFETLQNIFPDQIPASCDLFEDVPAAALEAEFSGEADPGDLPEIVRQSLTWSQDTTSASRFKLAV